MKMTVINPNEATKGNEPITVKINYIAMISKEENENSDTLVRVVMWGVLIVLAAIGTTVIYINL